MSPEKIIHDIREKKYGIGLDGFQREDFKAISSDLRSAIEQLSTGLYGEDVHFILELIQNAEDNDYAEGVLPDLKFVLLDQDPTGTSGSNGCLCLFNNEEGFSEKNVRSICATGKSTKAKASGYIGEKGIGFKSVFTASDEPHIISNGYQFKFKGLDLDPNIELAYVVPYWVDQLPSVAREDGYTTCLLLPLRAEQRRGIEQELERINPETILFLSKLENLSIELLDIGKTVNLIRDITNAPRIDLLVNVDGSDEPIRNYWLAKKTLQVPPDIHEAKREGVAERDISVVFPLTSDSCNGTLYAFLPTEIKSGLPFLVNADFLLTANRESIQINKPWSLWLRDSIAEVVVEGLKAISRVDEYQHLVCRYIPVKKNLKALNDFLIPVCDEACERLKETPVVLASTGELVKPELARIATKEERGALQACTDQTTFDKFKMVDSRLDHLTEQLRAVGVRELSVGDIKACLSDDAWLAQQNGQWFFELYSFLQKSSKLSKTSYEDLNLSKLEDCLVQAGGDTVYLPAVDALAVASISDFTDAGLPGVRFIDQELYKFLTSKSDVLHWCRQKLGWISFSYSGYLLNTILPHLNERVAEISPQQLLMASSGFVQIWGELDDNEKENVKENLPLLLDSGEIVTRDSVEFDEFVVPRAYDMKSGWQLFFADDEDCNHLCVLSDEYVSFNNTVDENDIDLFFNEMEVSSHPSLTIFVVSRGERYEAYQLYLDQVWRSFNESCTNTPTLNTKFPPLSFFSKEKRDNKQYRGALIRWLDDDVRKNVIGRATSSFSEKSKIEYFYRTSKAKLVQSGIDFYLNRTAWIKTSNGDKRPAEVFVKKQSIVDMFGDSLPYLEDAMSIELCQLLGIKTDITNETVMQSLKTLSNSSDPNEESINKFYKYLNEYGSDFVEAFKNDTIIYVPCVSKWFKPNEVVWDDESAVLGNLYGWLSTDYDQSGLRDFFVKKLGVKSSVDVEALADAWLALQGRNDLEVKEVEVRLSKIVPKLLSLVKSGNSLPEWWGKLQDDVMFWTQGDEFSDKDDVYYSDNHYLSRLFSDDINLAWIPDAGNSVSYYAPLFDELGVKAISEAVTHHCVIAGSVELITPRLLTEYSKRLLAYLVKNENPDEFEQWLGSGEIGLILRTVEAEVQNIEICYEISDWDVEKSVSDKNGFLDLDKQIVFRINGSDNEEVKDDIAEFIARAIWGTRYRDKEDKVKSILGVTSESRFRKLRDKKDWAMSRELMSRVDKCISQSAAVQESVDGGVEEEASPPNLDDRNLSQPGGSTGNPGVREGGAGRVSHTSLHQGNASVPRPRGNTNGGISNSGGAGSRTNMYSPGNNSGGGRKTTGKNGGGRSRSRQQTQRINAQNQRRIVTYVYPEPDNRDKDELGQDDQREFQQERHEIGEAAENFVVQYEQNSGWKARRMPINNPGYDIESVNENSGEARFIEVKGIDGLWGDRGVGISATQYQEALRRNSDYWLYVIEYARSDSPVIHRVNNPAKLIGEYRFDSGWRFLAVDNNIDSESVSSTVETYECLSDYTDDAGCKKIVDACLKVDIPAPDVGYELVDENGEVMAEFELAWEDVNICVVTSDQMDLQACDGWKVFSSSQIDSVLECLTEAYGKRLGEY